MNEFKRQFWNGYIQALVEVETFLEWEGSIVTKEELEYFITTRIEAHRAKVKMEEECH